MNRDNYIGRKKRTRDLKEDYPIIIAAFGSTGRGKIRLEVFEEEVRKKFPGKEVHWAFTSQIIRAKTGTLGLKEMLSKLEADGYRKAVVQPLYIFPGTEYEELMETCAYFPGMRIIVGETLFHRWDYVKDILSAIEQDFIAPQDGVNLIVAHGTPLAAAPANVVYLGMEHMLKAYDNTVLASIEGVPDKDIALKTIRTKFADCKEVRIIPMMYLAGIHVEDDLMGNEDSWRTELEGMGFRVSCPSVSYKGETYPKGLSFYSQTNQLFLDNLTNALKLTRHY